MDSLAEPARLDRYLADRLEVTRSKIQSWVKSGTVLVDGRTRRPSHLLQGGEIIEIPVAPLSSTGEFLEPEPGELELLYEDPDLAVIAKPVGLVVHPGAGQREGTLAHRLVARFPELAAVGHPQRPGIVHRLDRGTSGVMVVARNEASLQGLARQFERRSVGKQYLAVAYGRLSSSPLLVDAPIGRHPRHRTRMTVAANGRSARTRFEELRYLDTPRVSLLLARLDTGRTHQIRVHLKAEKHPLVGDSVYGENRWRAAPPPLQATLRDFPRPALHAWQLSFEHPRLGQALSFQAPLPDDLEGLWTAVGGTPLADLVGSS